MIGGFFTLPVNAAKFGFGLRSVSGESGAEGGEKRLANRSRSATPAAELTEARRAWRHIADTRSSRAV